MSSLPPVFMEFIGLTTGFRSATKQVMSGLDDVAKKGNGLGPKLTKGGLIALGAVSIAVEKIGAASVKKAGDFQFQMNRLVQAAGEAPSAIGKVGDGIKKIAEDTGSSLDDLYQGMYLIESAGFHNADALKIQAAAAQGAKIENADLATTSRALSVVLNDMGEKSGKNAAQYMSQMVAAVGHGQMTMQEFAGSLHNVLPNAAKLGIAFPEIAAGLAKLTSEGMSAEQASENLNHTIVKLAAPTRDMINNMASYGISAVDLSKNLGKRGLVGTLDMMSEAIMSRMGPSGLTLRKVFEQSKQAAADANREFAALPPEAQKVAQAWKNGTETLGGYRLDIKALHGNNATLLSQWKAMNDRSKGFSAALKSGGQDAQTYNAALKGMVGDQTAMTTVLKLSAGGAETYAAKVAAVAKAHQAADGSVEGWKQTQGLFNTQMDKLKSTFDVLEVNLGTKLLPAVTALTKWAVEHKTTIVILVSALMALLTIWGVLAAAVAFFTTVGRAAAGVKRLLAGSSRDVAAATEEETIATEEGTAAQQTSMLQYIKSQAAAVLYRAKMMALSAAIIAQNIATKAAALASKAWSTALDVGKMVQAATATSLIAAKQMIVSGATKAWAAAQWLLNVALDANPIVLIIIAIVALVAVIVLAYTHSKTFQKIVHEAFHYVADAADFLGRAIAKVFKGVMGFVDGVIGFFRQHGQTILEVILAPFTGGMSLILPWILRHWTGIQKWFTDLPGNIVNALSGVYDSMLTVGKNVVIGIWNGIAGMGDWLWKQIENFASNSIPGPIKKVLGIFSPSRVMADEIGRFIPAGIAQGIDAHSGIVSKSMQNLGTSISQFSPNVGTVSGGIGGLAGMGNGNVVIHSHTYLNGKEIATSVETQNLRTGMRRGGTYQGFRKR